MSKTEIKLFSEKEGLNINTDVIVNNIKDAVEFGEVDPLQVGIFVKKIEKIAKAINSDENFKKVVHEETLKHFTNKKYVGYGMTISEKAVHTAYDFAICGDPIHSRLTQILTQVKELLKSREEDLVKLIDDNPKFGVIKAAHKEVITQLPILMWEDGDGEEVTINAPIKYQKIGLVYKEDKQ